MPPTDRRGTSRVHRAQDDRVDAGQRLGHAGTGPQVDPAATGARDVVTGAPARAPRRARQIALAADHHDLHGSSSTGPAQQGHGRSRALPNLFLMSTFPHRLRRRGRSRMGRATVPVCRGPGLAQRHRPLGPGRRAVASRHATTGSARVLAGGALGPSKAYLVPGLAETAQLLAGFGRCRCAPTPPGSPSPPCPGPWWTPRSARHSSPRSPRDGVAVVGAVAAYLIWRHRDRLMGRTAPMVD